MQLGNVQGSPQNHILHQSVRVPEKFCTLCGITNGGSTITLTRTNEERPLCDYCQRVEESNNLA